MIGQVIGDTHVGGQQESDKTRTQSNGEQYSAGEFKT
jgi:hypothetical protein